jgi:hypothetical protein
MTPAIPRSPQQYAALAISGLALFGWAVALLFVLAAALSRGPSAAVPASLALTLLALEPAIRVWQYGWRGRRTC